MSIKSQGHSEKFSELIFAVFQAPACDPMEILGEIFGSHLLPPGEILIYETINQSFRRLLSEQGLIQHFVLNTIKSCLVTPVELCFAMECVCRNIDRLKEEFPKAPEYILAHLTFFMDHLALSPTFFFRLSQRCLLELADVGLFSMSHEVPPESACEESCSDSMEVDSCLCLSQLCMELSDYKDDLLEGMPEKLPCFEGVPMTDTAEEELKTLLLDLGEPLFRHHFVSYLLVEALKRGVAPVACVCQYLVHAESLSEDDIRVALFHLVADLPHVRLGSPKVADCLVDLIHLKLTRKEVYSRNMLDLLYGQLEKGPPGKNVDPQASVEVSSF